MARFSFAVECFVVVVFCLAGSIGPGRLIGPDIEDTLFYGIFTCNGADM